MLIRRATPADAPAIWAMLEPVIRGGETYALPRDMSATDALAYWMAPHHTVFIAHLANDAVGTYYLRANQLGGGAHVANAGYVTAQDFGGRGVAEGMCRHSMEEAKAQGYAAMQFNCVVRSNEHAVRLWHRLGFATVGTLPRAFDHPRLGRIDAFVMYREL